MITFPQIYQFGRPLTAQERMRAPMVTATEDGAVTAIVMLMIEHDISASQWYVTDSPSVSSPATISYG